MGMVKDIPRIMKREVQKLAYYLPRAIVLLLLYLIPGIGQTVAPLLWFGFSAWMLAIQYCDYPFDSSAIRLTRKFTKKPPVRKSGKISMVKSTCLSPVSAPAVR